MILRPSGFGSHKAKEAAAERAGPPPNTVLESAVVPAVCVVMGHGGLRGQHKSSSSQVVPVASAVPKHDTAIHFLLRNRESQNNKPEC